MRYLLLDRRVASTRLEVIEAVERAIRDDNAKKAERDRLKELKEIIEEGIANGDIVQSDFLLDAVTECKKSYLR